LSRSKKSTQNAIFVGATLALILAATGIYLPDFWLNAFLIVVSWTVATIIARRFISDEGLSSYIVYFVGILIASFLSEILSKVILGFIRIVSVTATDPKNAYYLIGSAVMCLCVYYDLHLEFSEKEERKQ
jgi:hypothetical protein